MTDDAFAPGTLLAGKFRIVRTLGEGGMGSVYEIEHELTKHRRALKLLHAAMAASPSIVERFLREASAAGRVGNPHIVETFDAGQLDTGEPYLVMEILRGEPLSHRIARGAMAVPEVVDLMGQACVGVAAAHAAGIVHRDLKPDNLFIVTGADGRPFVKILDFGISKFDTTQTGGMQLTKEGSAMGTPYYMSPEQIRGVANLDARADVYALGVILYECLTAKRPFESDVLTHLAVLIHAGQTQAIEEMRPDLPAGLADLVRFAMASDRERRMQSAVELRTALERFGSVSGAPFRAPTLPNQSLAHPPSAVQARSMATSGVGVSMRTPTTAPKRSHTPLIASVVGLGLLTLGGGYLLLRGLSSDAGGPVVPATSSESASTVAAEPTPQPPAAPPPAVPPAISSEKAAPAAAPLASVPPSAAPRTAPPAPVGAAAASRPAVVSAPAPATPGKPGRAEERGLAKDNPFK